MSEVEFQFFKENSVINFCGNDFNINSLHKFLELLKEIEQEGSINNLKVIGNFNTKLVFYNLFANQDKNKIDNILNLLQSISRIMQESEIIFTSELKGIVKGPAMEIALSCNYIKANEDTIIQLDNEYLGIMPILGTAQRLARLIGYKDTLQAFLIEKKLTFDEALRLKLFNNETDNLVKVKNNLFFWDQSFTNTFIFYNTKIHSIYKNEKPDYNALLSTVFESSVCKYSAGLDIEKRWLKWLIRQKLKNVRS